MKELIEQDYENVKTIDITSRANIMLNIDNRLDIKLGSSADIGYKLSYFKAVMGKLADNYEGTLIYNGSENGVSAIPKDKYIGKPTFAKDPEKTNTDDSAAEDVNTEDGTDSDNSADNGQAENDVTNNGDGQADNNGGYDENGVWTDNTGDNGQYYDNGGWTDNNWDNGQYYDNGGGYDYTYDNGGYGW